MFEKAKPQAIPPAHRLSAREVQDLDLASRLSHTDDAIGEAIPLRAIEWSELTARLSAARDLRQLLREDAGERVGARKLGFAEAAAQFFRTNEDDERPVNPTALEACKASSGKYVNVMSGQKAGLSSEDDESTDGVATTRQEPGDAREEQ
jgi:hypothetical protein